jgi:hypothetical protein
MYTYQLTSSPTGPAQSPRDATAHAESPMATRHGAPEDIYNASPLWSPTGAGSASQVTLPLALLGGGTLLISPHAIGSGTSSEVPDAGWADRFPYAPQADTPASAHEHTEPTLAAVVADAYVSGQQLREAWAAVVEGWAGGAVALLCDKAAAIASDIPPEAIRESFAQVVHDSLAQDLGRVCSGRLRVEALGLNAPMPPAMQAALANAMQTEIEADALLDPSAEAGDTAARDRLVPLLGAPAIELLQHPILGPLFEALHRSVPVPSAATLR